MSPMEGTARAIAQRLRERGHIAYFAGGSVRDMVRGLPAKDFDIATDATPDVVQKIFSRTYAVGAHFGVVVVVENNFNFEVATFRADGAYLDHRHPVDVRFSSPEEDAKRRDFTINGMFFDPEKNEVIDFVGGRADIEKKIVRAIGDPTARFSEDRLRMLRAVRFATVLDYKIDNQTWDALLASAQSINEISAERIREELLKIFLSPNRVRGWEMLDQSGMMRNILPELEAMKGCLQPEQFHPEGDVFQHTKLMLGLLPEKVSVPLVLSVLFHDVGKPITSTVDETGRIRFNEHDRIGAAMTESIMERLRFSRAEIDAVVEMVRQHMVFKDVPKMRVAKLKRFMARPTFEEELELHRVDCASSHQMMDNYEFLLRKREEFANEPIIPPPLVRGDDLIALGMKPGPKFGEILEAVETRQLEGALKDRQQALDWVKSEYLSEAKAKKNRRSTRAH
ncbi:MAG TPA: CCA tRNA nucleotidyltransferase [Chthoniobacterales bacterium]|jgi:poly(A) polymerase|nr:CCA tRNA nucleotidyltransferase [Chthoniobacterales bacterium]